MCVGQALLNWSWYVMDCATEMLPSPVVAGVAAMRLDGEGIRDLHSSCQLGKSFCQHVAIAWDNGELAGWL